MVLNESNSLVNNISSGQVISSIYYGTEIGCQILIHKINHQADHNKACNSDNILQQIVPLSSHHFFIIEYKKQSNCNERDSQN